MTDNNYRDPKVTQDHKSDGGGGAGKWLGIAAAVIVLLLLLAWLFGLFDDDVDTVGAADPDAVIVTPEGGDEAVIVTD